MNEIKMLNAIGMIDDELIANAKRKKVIKKHRFMKRMIAVAAVLCVSMPLPVATAYGNDTAYNLLYHIAPNIAQTFKPIQKSCIDSGIKMEVISAGIEDGTAKICISLQNLEQNRIMDKVDLYDSYNVNFYCDTTNHCNFLKYDERTNTSYLLVCIDRMDGKPLDSGKVTFKFSELLFNKKEKSGVLSDINLKNIPIDPPTISDVVYRGWSGNCRHKVSDSYDGEKCLIPSDTPICGPAEGVAVTAIGYIDGMLHIQSYYEDIAHTDNHGFIGLADKNGKQCEPYNYYCLSFWDKEQKGSYDETIIDMPYSEIENYQLYGEFVTCNGYAKGNWNVTFSLEDVILK